MYIGSGYIFLFALPVVQKKSLLRSLNNLIEYAPGFIKFTIKEDNQSIEIFFDINDYNLIGWQTKDVYQNTAVTLLYSIKSNQIVDEKIFKTPLQN